MRAVLSPEHSHGPRGQGWLSQPERLTPPILYLGARDATEWGATAEVTIPDLEPPSDVRVRVNGRQRVTVRWEAPRRLVASRFEGVELALREVGTEQTPEPITQRTDPSALQYIQRT